MTDEHENDLRTSAREEAASPHAQHWGSILRNVVLAVVVLGMVWLVLNVQLPSVSELRAMLDELGGAAWIGFVLLYAVVAVTPIPVTIMAVTAGVLFGLVEGTILSVIGVLIGCWAAYWLARALGRTTVMRLLGQHAATVEQHLDHAGMRAVFLLRVMPGLPYWPVNYGSGAFGIAQRDFVVASALSTVPGQLSLVAIGAFIANPSLIRGIVVIIAWMIVVTMTILAYRSWKQVSRQQRTEAVSDTP